MQINHLPKRAAVLLLRETNGSVLDLGTFANVYKKASAVAVQLRDGKFANEQVQGRYNIDSGAFSFDSQDASASDEVVSEEPATTVASASENIAKEMIAGVEAVSENMRAAIRIIERFGYKPVQLKTMKGQRWRDLVAAAATVDVRDCLQAWRWCGGDLKQLYADRAAQAAKRGRSS